MCEPEQHVVFCARCGTQVIIGHLKDPVEPIIVESVCSLETSTLEALICPNCGHVELQATHPEDLARHDISEDEPDAGATDLEEWLRSAGKAHA